MLALDVRRAVFAKDVDKPGLVPFAVDDLGRDADVAQQAGEFSLGVGKIGLAFDDELTESRDLCHRNVASILPDISNLACSGCEGLSQLSEGFTDVATRRAP